MADLSEGDRCPRYGADCCGRLQWTKPDECSCHISAPCGHCERQPLVCDDCGEIIEAGDD